MIKRIKVIDSQTEGEPTRLVIAGGPDLGDGPLSARLRRFREDYDHFRSAVVNEPRGSDALVGALLLEPSEPSCAAGVIFFNNVGYLGMCGHGTIGVIATLAYLGRIQPGEHRLETPAGVVVALLETSGNVIVRNVPSYRYAQGVRVPLPEGEVRGDIAWGGNWFFVSEAHGQEISAARVDDLIEYAWMVRKALHRAGITGPAGQEIDHIELCGPPQAADADAKNFVLCPGKVYDRSPCGTGLSAKLACMYADGKMQPGQVWRQESILGTIFEGSIALCNGQLIPSIRGSAHVTAEANLILDERDPFQYGIRR